MNPRARAILVVFDDSVSDVEATMVRNGVQMFAGVRQVLPVRGVPSDLSAAKAIAQKDLTEALCKAERERDELAAAVRAVGEVLAPIPLPSPPGDDVVPLEPRRLS